MAVIVVDNQKGGVGKTTLAFNLAHGLAAKGMSVLAVDNDPQFNLTSSFLEDPAEDLKANVLDIYEKDAPKIEPQRVCDNLYLIGSNIHLAKVAESDFEIIYKLREVLDPIKSQFDVTIIDCLPSFGFLNLAALNASDYVLIPTKAAPYSLSGMKDLFDTIEKSQKRFNPNLEIMGIVVNLFEQTVVAREYEDSLRERYNGLVFPHNIRKAVKVEESPAFNQPIMEYEPKSQSAKDFDAFCSEVIKRLPS